MRILSALPLFMLSCVCVSPGELFTFCVLVTFGAYHRCIAWLRTRFRRSRRIPPQEVSQFEHETPMQNFTKSRTDEVNECEELHMTNASSSTVETGQNAYVKQRWPTSAFPNSSCLSSPAERPRGSQTPNTFSTLLGDDEDEAAPVAELSRQLQRFPEAQRPQQGDDEEA